MRYFIFLILICLISCSQPLVEKRIDATNFNFKYDYIINLTNPSAHLFNVTLFVDGLGSSNNIFNFAGYGMQAKLDFGQYVHSFRAFDQQGSFIPSRKISANQWELSAPQKVDKIVYQVAPTWDSPNSQNVIPDMVGTALEEDFAFINGKGILGFFRGMENELIRIQLRCPQNWIIGTSLTKDFQENLIARSYAEAISSPILAGKLSYQARRIVGSDVYVYTYSKTNTITADDLLKPIDNALKSTYFFIKEVPLETYTTLFVFDEKNAGGVEYHNSSAFVFEEAEFSKIRQDIQDVIAHEYFHLIIPFSIRSDVFDEFNVLNPRPTGHLWFFEGVTEWASDIMQLRNQQKSMRDFFLNDFRRKLIQEDLYRSESSLYEISLNSNRSPEDYLSVYSRGAIAATLLDIYLLDLTDGRRGLREVIYDLQLDYGKERPLPEERFFEILIDYSGPETEDFIQSYIAGNEKLPVAEVLSKIGVNYRKSEPANPPQSDLGMMLAPNNGHVTVAWVNDQVAAMGIHKGDILRSVEGMVVRAETIGKIYDRISGVTVGTPYSAQILRNGKLMKIEARTVRRQYRHVFRVEPMLTPKQNRVRNAWLRNLE